MEYLLSVSPVLNAGDGMVAQIHGSHSSVGQADINQLLTQIDVKMLMC